MRAEGDREIGWRYSLRLSSVDVYSLTLIIVTRPGKVNHMTYHMPIGDKKKNYAEQPENKVMAKFDLAYMWAVAACMSQ